MKCYSLIASLAFAAAAMDAVQADGATKDGGKAWSYKTNDPNVYSPSEWKIKYPTCGGQRQSPIDIVPKELCGDQSQKRDKLPLVLSGECSQFQVKQYDDAFKAETLGGSCQVSLNGKAYPFAQAHYHAPSEHTVNGKAHDAEMHYVHKNSDGILVIGMFFEKDAKATTDPFVAQFLQTVKNVTDHKPSNVTLPSFFPSLQSTIDAGRLFNYPGSLTTPTCDETVTWFVVEKPLKISAADFDAMQVDLKRIEASDNGKNARPTQPLNGRTVTVY